MMIRRRIRLVIVLAGMLWFTGCSNQLPTYPVQGHVFFPSGVPVKTGTVELKSREHGVQARGPIQTDGSFQLTTYREHDGAVAGIHDCVIVQFVMAEDVSGHRPSTLGVVDPRYASYSTSDLSVEIFPDKENVVKLEVVGLQKTPIDDVPHEH